MSVSWNHEEVKRAIDKAASASETLYSAGVWAPDSGSRHQDKLVSKVTSMTMALGKASTIMSTISYALTNADNSFANADDQNAVNLQLAEQFNDDMNAKNSGHVPVGVCHPIPQVTTSSQE